MLILDEQQTQALQELDNQQFVTAVCDKFLSKRPDRLQDPGRDGVLERMQAAFDYAKSIGMTSTSHMIRLMYLEADAPNMHEDPFVDAHLRKPGATPEQRLDDLLAVLDNQLKQMQKGKSLWQ